jgi:probable phosphoglycerate mutase
VQIEHLKARFINEKIDAVYASDLTRASVTASAIYEPHGLVLNKTDQLREVKLGEWEDMAWGDIEYYFPEMNRYFSIDPEKWHIEGNEDFHHVQKRMADCILEIAEQYDGGTVAVFSHGLAIRMFISGISGIPSNEIKRVPYFDNTAVTLLRYDNGGFAIEFQGDNSHLSKEYSTFANQSWWRSEKLWVYENLRFMTLNKERDSAIWELYRNESGRESSADVEYTAFIGQEAVAIVGLDTVYSGENYGWIDYIFVKPEFRLHNFGIQLVGQAVSHYRRLKRDKLRIEVPLNSTSLDFFRKFEFEKTAETDAYCILEKNIRNWG